MNKIYRSLASENRRKIIKLLLAGDLSVNELVANFFVSQATISSHLSYLKLAGLVNVVKMGRKRIYSLNRDVLVWFVNNLIREFGGGGGKYIDILERRRPYNK